MNFSWSQHKKTFGIVGLVCAVLIVGAVYFSVQGTFCIARIGVAPGADASDPGVFLNTVERIDERARGSLVRQFDRESGFFLYAMHPNGDISSQNNDIRQLLGSRILAVEAHHDALILELHQKNLEAIFSQWFVEAEDKKEKIGYVYVDEKSKLGANAMLLRVLAASPLFAEYEREAAMLAKSIYHVQQEDGSFVPWYKEPEYEYDSAYLLTFYSGEAILALLEYGEVEADSQAIRAATRAQDFYIGEYVDRIAENYYPAYVPWHTLSLAKLHQLTGDERYSEAVFVLTDKLLELQDGERFVGRFYNPETPEYGSPHASSDAVYTEGLAAALGVAKRSNDTEREARYKTALVLAVHNLKSLQYEPTHLEALFLGDEARHSSGGIKTNVCNNWIRIDSTAHSMDALAKIKAILSE